MSEEKVICKICGKEMETLGKDYEGGILVRKYSCWHENRQWVQTVPVTPTTPSKSYDEPKTYNITNLLREAREAEEKDPWAYGDD